jgi:hypothetical protein
VNVLACIESHYEQLSPFLQLMNLFNQDAYTVRIFMPFGDPDGLRIIDQPNWAGIGVAFPRGAYRDVSKRTEFARTGIYVLVGSSSENGLLPTLYIGQSDKISARLDSHHKTKDFWEWAVFFVSKDNALNVASAQYIESRLINRAIEAKRCNLDNGNAPVGPNLADADAADAEGFMAHILRVLPLIGISAFEEKERKLKARERVILTCTAKKRGVIATGYVQAGGFVVCKDSLADPEEKSGMHDYMRSIRKELLEKEILVKDGALYRFTQDYDLSSPSTAAGVVLGSASNGRTQWIDMISKKTLKTLQEEEAGE